MSRASIIDRPWDLRVEHVDEAFGIDVARPRVSWKLPIGTSRQLAWEVDADGWCSGRVEGRDQVLVPWGGPGLRSRQRVRWRVRVWTDRGRSAWSDPAALELGLLEPADWTAAWISPVEPDGPGRPGHRPAHVLRRAFTHDGDAAVARLYATAHGIYELFLNGERVGDHELTPGYTSYAHRLQVQTFDVGDLLRPGDNELRAVLSDGWFRGQVGYHRHHSVWGGRTALLAQLEIGGEVVARTDGSWEAGGGSITAADLMEGQHSDLRAEEGRGGAPVEVVDHPLGQLCASPAPPVRRTRVLVPSSVRRLDTDRQIVDLGQNINGWLRLDDIGPAGSLLRITHGEALGEDGDVDVEHLRPFDWAAGAHGSAGQIDGVVSDGVGPFEPRHTTHGFRYARIEGHPGDLTPDDVTGVVVHTDLRRTGWFRCSDPRIDRLHEIALWSFLGNACDIPTDCPQRERAGWAGDWQVFSPTAAFLFDVAGFSAKWLADLAADQTDEGVVPNYAPEPVAADPGMRDIDASIRGGAGWGDAVVLVPWAMWQAYGDAGLLERMWPAMAAWVEHQRVVARDQRHPSRIERSATPAPHEQFLWDTGWHWGEWLEPGRGVDWHMAHLGRDMGIIATAYFAHSCGRLADIAGVLARTADEDRYRTLATSVVDAWRTEFVDDDGRLRSGRQSDHVRALAFGLVPDELRAPVADRLVELVRSAGTHLDTGFLATPLLLPVLADAGHADVAYDLLFQETAPSWLAMVDRGATTIWEDWAGRTVVDAAAGANALESLNHYSKGAVISFLHRHVGGIRPVDGAPAYERFRLAPLPGGGITAAEAVHDSPHGRIRSSWTLQGDRFRVEAEVPPGTTARLDLPDGTGRDLRPGSTVAECVLGPAG